MLLSSLIQDLPFLEMKHFADLEIRGLGFHSEKIEAGFLFVAIPGAMVDGHQFAPQALQKGAIALVVEREVSAPKDIPVFKVRDSSAALSRLSAIFQGNPSRELQVAGVTGTNGKTTTTFLLEAFSKAGGKRPGVLGTLGSRFDGVEKPSTHTTPESLEIQRTFREMRNHGVDTAIMEVSSHAMDLRRVDDVCFDVAIFTNLTPEHLDYHKSMELYFESKKRLFTQLLPKGKGAKRAILNADDPYGLKLIELCKEHDQSFWTFSMKAQSRRDSPFVGEANPWDFYVREWTGNLQGMSGTIATPDGTMAFSSHLIGAFNLSNILGAVAAGRALEIPLESMQHALSNFPGVPGRLERVANSRGIHVFVDYAHTPDALKNVLKTLKNLDPARILTVFGCGGDRDRSKRPMMGREAARLSDLVFVTSDNPRTEDPQAILKEIIPGILEGGMTPGKECLVEIDRQRAIERALTEAKAGDVVLIAGKGHEDYQILGKEKIHFDDREIARKALQ